MTGWVSRLEGIGVVSALIYVVHQALTELDTDITVLYEYWEWHHYYDRTTNDPAWASATHWTHITIPVLGMEKINEQGDLWKNTWDRAMQRQQLGLQKDRPENHRIIDLVMVSPWTLAPNRSHGWRLH
jgi:hypothetical protein